MTDEPSVVDATRESPADHPNDHIDVTIDHEDGGRSILRFDIAGPSPPDTAPAEVARYRYELLYNDVTIDTEQELIDLAAAYITEEMGIATETGSD